LALAITIADADEYYNSVQIAGVRAEGNKTISGFNTNGDPVGTVLANTVEELEIEVANSTAVNSNATYSLSIFAEDSETLPDTSVQLQVDGVNYGAPVNVVTLDPSAILNISW